MQKTQKKNLAMTVFLAIIMITSILGFALNRQTNNQNVFNGYSFEQKGDFWITEINDQTFEFSFLPDATEDIYFQNEEFDPVMTYLVSNPNANYSESDLQSIDYSKFELKNNLEKLGYDNILFGFTQSFQNNKPITCADTTSTTTVINFEISNITKITSENNCITLYGMDGNEIIRAKDRFIYSIAKII